MNPVFFFNETSMQQNRIFYYLKPKYVIGGIHGNCDRMEALASRDQSTMGSLSASENFHNATLLDHQVWLMGTEALRDLRQ